MEALAALGVAANIAQFIDFASSLVSKSFEVYQNGEGCADDVSSIAATYDKLRDLGDGLGNLVIDPNVVIGHPELGKILDNFGKLSRACKEDCDNLLKVTEKLQNKGQPSDGWRSFKSALKTMWKAKQIKELELRLHRSQITLTVHVSALTSHSQRICKLQLDEMRDECRILNTQQHNKLQQIADMIIELERFIRAKGADHSEIKKRIQLSDIVDLQDQLTQLTLTSTEIDKGNLLLRSLVYERQTARPLSIPDAHTRTFAWVLDNDKGAQIGPTAGNLSKWLRAGEKCFWVSGKPGSGKSTVMKYISEHKATIKALRQWSPDLPVIVGRHFFWSAGSSMQKSRQGLLQNLLYEIFSQVPDLMPLTCGQRWTALTKHQNDMSWNTREMDDIFLQLAIEKDLPVRFCFFIDGLDEYEGDHVEICQLLCNLSKSPYIKFCISSRPWNVFEDAFGHHESQKLYVHELTRQDIQLYSKELLQTHPRWTALKREREDGGRLIKEISDRAEGVFLWVYLVVKELREGLSEYDSFSDLLRRLEIIPTDLEVFFKQILDSVPKSYHCKMATTLQIACRVSEPLDALFYDFSDMEHDDLDYAKNMAMCYETDKDRVRRRDIFSRRLKARTKGLLEVQPLTGRVDFLHRTVLEFLNTDNMSAYVGRRVPPDLDFNRSMLKATIAWVKTVEPTSTMHFIVGLAAFHTKNAEAVMSSFNLIEEFEKSIGATMLHAAPLIRAAYTVSTNTIRAGGLQRLSSLIENSTRETSLTPPGEESLVTLFRLSILKEGAYRYIHYALDNNRNYFSLLPKSPMSILLELDTFNTETLETLRCLLRHKENPNAIVDDRDGTLWEAMLNKFLGCGEQLSWSLETGLLSMMLQFGADPYLAWKEILSVFVWIPGLINAEKPYLKLLDEVCTKVESIEASGPEYCDRTARKFPQIDDLGDFLDAWSSLQELENCEWLVTNQIPFALFGKILARVLVNVDEATRDQAVWVEIERGLGREAAFTLRERVGMIEASNAFQARFQ